MKNFKIIGCLLGLLFVLISVGDVKANCSNCLAYSSDSQFCNKGGYIYHKDGGNCYQFKFIGLNVKALSRLNDTELEEVLIQAASMGVTVIRFSAANGNINTTVAAQRAMHVLDYARGYNTTHEQNMKFIEAIQNMKFIITLADFYGNHGTYTGTDGDGVYYPVETGIMAVLTDHSPYITVDGTKVLHPDFFRPDDGAFSEEPIFYQKNYETWVREIISQLAGNTARQKQILSIELCNDLSSIAEPTVENMRRIKGFIKYIAQVIKTELPLLVSIGNTSTHHTLNGNLNDIDINEFRKDVYYWKDPDDSDLNDVASDMLSKVDFMTTHNYNNEWSQSNKQFRGYLRQDEDFKYSRAKQIPIVVVEFGFSGNTATTEAFGGGCWESNIPYAIPPATGGQLFDRPCAINNGIYSLFGHGASGVMAADFNPFGTDKGLGGESAELDARSDDYDYLKQIWTLRSSHPFSNNFQTGFYECRDGMILDETPPDGPRNIVCESAGKIEVTHTITPNFSIAYNSGEDVTFFPSDSGEGFDADVGTDATAEIKAIDCLNCSAVAPKESCNTSTDCCGADKNKASYWRCVSYTEAGIVDWNVSKGLDYNMYNCVNAWNYYASVYNRNPDKFLWVGFAKLAGDYFYEGFQDIHVARKALESGVPVHVVAAVLIEGLSNAPAYATLPAATIAGIDDLINSYSAQAAIDHLWLIERTFLTMQKQIFDDIVWQHLAYHHGSQNGGNGFEFLRDILLNDSEYKNKYSQDVTQDIIDTWEAIHMSQSPADDLAYQGLVGIANLEQNHVIADTYDEMRGYDRKWHIGDNVVIQGIFQMLSHIAESPIDGNDLYAPQYDGRLLRDVVPLGNVTNRVHRWSWITNDMAPRFFDHIKYNRGNTNTVIYRSIDMSNHNDPRLLSNEIYPFPLNTTDIRIRDPKECNGETRIPDSKQQTPLEDNQYQFTIQPNPFNTQTEIVFNLTEDAPVTIRVTDMMGRHVATLADDEMKTTGEHIVIFNGSQYPSGMYMTHIQVGAYSGTQKMILAK